MNEQITKVFIEQPRVHRVFLKALISELPTLFGQKCGIKNTFIIYLQKRQIKSLGQGQIQLVKMKLIQISFLLSSFETIHS